MLVLATNERFLPTGGTFEAILASESHWLQPILVLSVHWWPTRAGLGRVLDSKIHSISLTPPTTHVMPRPPPAHG